MRSQVRFLLAPPVVARVLQYWLQSQSGQGPSKGPTRVHFCPSVSTSGHKRVRWRASPSPYLVWIPTSTTSPSMRQQSSVVCQRRRFADGSADVSCHISNLLTSSSSNLRTSSPTPRRTVLTQSSSTIKCGPDMANGNIETLYNGTTIAGYKVRWRDSRRGTRDVIRLSL